MKRILTTFGLIASVAALGACEKGDSKKLEDLDERVARLEAQMQKLSEIEAFLRPIMEQQKQAAEAEARKEPAPDVRFSVPVAGNFYHGPEDAPVTIVEAFDFA